MELLEDGTVLKAPFPGPEIEDLILNIAKKLAYIVVLDHIKGLLGCSAIPEKVSCLNS